MLGHGGRKPWIISSESLVQLISGMRAAALVSWKKKQENEFRRHNEDHRPWKEHEQRASANAEERICITIYFLQGDLTKNVQVGAIQGSPEHPVNPGVVGMEQSLGSDAVCNEPNA